MHLMYMGIRISSEQVSVFFVVVVVCLAIYPCLSFQPVISSSLYLDLPLLCFHVLYHLLTSNSQSRIINSHLKISLNL